MNIATMIKQLAAQGGSGMGFTVGTVTAVDKAARTVDVEPLNEEAPLLGVNLQANQGSTVGVVQIPRKGSFVMVGFVQDGAAGMVLLCDDIEEAQVVVKDAETASIVVSEDGIVMNGGELRGLVKIAELENNLDQLKKYVEKLKSATSSGLYAVGVSTAANGPAASETFDENMRGASINFKNMENEKVKQ